MRPAEEHRCALTHEYRVLQSFFDLVTFSKHGGWKGGLWKYSWPCGCLILLLYHNMKLEGLEAHFDFPQNKNKWSWKFTAFSFKDVLHSALSSEICIIHLTSKLQKNLCKNVTLVQKTHRSSTTIILNKKMGFMSLFFKDMFLPKSQESVLCQSLV